MSYKSIPNLLTILRMLLVIPCAYALLHDYNKTAILIFMLASITDCFDGLLARKLGCQSHLGAVLDPLADKFLISSLFIVLTMKNLIPLWFASMVIVRELILLTGAAFYRFMYGPVIFIPTMLSKINTVLLLLLLFLTLVQHMSSINLGLDLGLVNYYLLIVILFTSTYSVIDYIVKWTIRVYKTAQASS